MVRVSLGSLLGPTRETGRSSRLRSWSRTGHRHSAAGHADHRVRGFRKMEACGRAEESLSAG